ncbi:hypothetical protein AN958_00473 [Leucoagaricus sp. SymC.cos]|nr:hypothetical protein AN958_00473 [Leucoagaricus sp. SymC.cos]
MTLFGGTTFIHTNTQLSPQSGPLLTSPTRIPGLGYILFPAPGSHSYSNTPPDSNVNGTSITTESTPAEEPDHINEAQSTTEEPLSDDAKRRRELEAEEARKGEEDWVRSGGVLRDAQGRRDWARTQAVREELKLRELEAQVVARWDNYEKCWVEFLGRVKRGNDTPDPNTLLRFHHIPWPVKLADGLEVQGKDLTVQRVEEFLLEGLSVRGATFTKKDRVRSSLLRWHPDKLGNLLQQVHPDDKLGKGLGVVMECLQRMNTQPS